MKTVRRSLVDVDWHTSAAGAAASVARVDFGRWPAAAGLAARHAALEIEPHREFTFAEEVAGDVREKAD